MTEPMTEDEALADVRHIISGVVLVFSEDLYLVAQDAFFAGDDNADTIIRALHSAGWSWVRREGA